MTLIIVFWSVPLAFLISIIIGVVFGVYPAIRAAGGSDRGLRRE